VTLRKIEFRAADNTLVELECDDRFLALVREKVGLLEIEEITEAHLKYIFTEVIKGATRT
jgi:hypothetical protein